MAGEFKTRELKAFVDLLVDYAGDDRLVLPGLPYEAARETNRRDTERHVMRVLDAVVKQCGGKR